MIQTICYEFLELLKSDIVHKLQVISLKKISKTNWCKFYSHSLRLRVVDAQGSGYMLITALSVLIIFSCEIMRMEQIFWMAALLRPKAQVASVVVHVFETEHNFQSLKD